MRWSRKKPAHFNAAYHQRIHRDQSNLIPLDPEAFIQKALALLSSDRYLEKGLGLMALTGRRLELHAIYQRSNGQKPEFLSRIIPIILNDARFNEFQDRDAYAEHWTTQFKTMDQSLTKLAAEQKLSRVAMDDFRRYKEMQKWYLCR